VNADGQASGADTIVLAEATAEGDGTENIRLYIADGSSAAKYLFKCTLVDHAATSNAVTGTTSFDDGSGWHHVAMVYRSGDTTLRLFVDGVEEGTPDSTTSGQIGTAFDEGESWRIGSGEASTARFFNGKIEEVYFFKEVGLSDAQIKTLAQSRIKGIGIAWMTAGGWYLPLDDQPTGTSADGDTIRDIVYGNNATGDDGVGNANLTWSANTILSYPED